MIEECGRSDVMAPLNNRPEAGSRTAQLAAKWRHTVTLTAMPTIVPNLSDQYRSHTMFWFIRNFVGTKLVMGSVEIIISESMFNHREQ